jgi:hypothetical protein
MSTGIIFYVLFALLLKHLIIDFPVFSSYMPRDIINTHSSVWYAHILLHGLATMFILSMMSFSVPICVSLGLLDLVSHWLIDSMTISIGRKCKYNQEFSKNFSWIGNMDQFLHSVIYVGLTFMLVLI